MADPLLQPFQLKHLTLKNRVISTSHEPAYSEEALPKARYRLYHEEKAKGGIGMTMIGGSSIVAPDSPQAFGNLYVGSDAIIPWFKELTAGVHKHGAAVMCQITHLGRRTSWAKEHWLSVISPSSVREPAHRAFPKEMEDFDFTRVVAAYGAGARRCREGGLDGIEIEAYGHLFDAFWSPNTNERTDQYGTQSLDNRLRFSFDVLREVRRQVGVVVGPQIRRGGGVAVPARVVADQPPPAAEQVARALDDVAARGGQAVDQHDRRALAGGRAGQHEAVAAVDAEGNRLWTGARDHREVRFLPDKV